MSKANKGAGSSHEDNPQISNGLSRQSKTLFMMNPDFVVASDGDQSSSNDEEEGDVDNSSEDHHSPSNEFE